MTDPATIAAGLSVAQRVALISAPTLADGRVLVPAYSVPDYMTKSYSVQRSELNRAGLAARAILKGE